MVTTTLPVPAPVLPPAKPKTRCALCGEDSGGLWDCTRCAVELDKATERRLEK